MQTREGLEHEWTACYENRNWLCPDPINIPICMVLGVSSAPSGPEQTSAAVEFARDVHVYAIVPVQIVVKLSDLQFP